MPARAESRCAVGPVGDLLARILDPAVDPHPHLRRHIESAKVTPKGKR